MGRKHRSTYLNLAISDVALAATQDGIGGEVELRAQRKLTDGRLSALAEAVKTEATAGFPSGQLFLDSVELALAVALVRGYAIRHSPVHPFRGGLGAARLRRVKELVHTRLQDDLSLLKLAQSVGLSTAHFARMFRKSMGGTPHQYVLHQRIERAKEMLHGPGAGVLEVAVACGFKTQQHFAHVFRNICGASPTEFRQQFLGQEVTCTSEICSQDTLQL